MSSDREEDHRSVLATIGQLRESLVLSAREEEEARAVAAGLRDAKALELSPGINVLVGANGTGKTHLMKVCYAACEVSKTGKGFADKLVRIFMPSGWSSGRMAKRERGGTTGRVEVWSGEANIETSVSNMGESNRADSNPGQFTGTVQMEKRGAGWRDTEIESVYIPVKEMLASGFVSPPNLPRRQGRQGPPHLDPGATGRRRAGQSLRAVLRHGAPDQPGLR